MLKHLLIKNYALIDVLDIDFHEGFSVITGETGAGKSIILGAIGLLLGQRADSKSVKTGSTKCSIEAEFDISKYDLNKWFEDNDLEYENGDCIIRRELTIAGKSRGFINDTPVTLTQMRELGDMLIDVHSQHQNLLLQKENFQLKVVDIIATDEELKNNYQAAYYNYNKARKELDKLRNEITQSKEDEDYIRFQLEELQDAALQNGEQEELEQEQQAISHSEEIKEFLYEADSLLNNEDNGILSKLNQTQQRVKNASNIFPRLNTLNERIDSSFIELKDIAQEIEEECNNIDYDPDRLSFLNERLDKIYFLEKKYKKNTVNELIEEQEKLQQAIDKIDYSDEAINKKEKEVEHLLAITKQQAIELTECRRRIVPELRKEVKTRLVALGMPSAEFDIEITPQELGIDGQDKISFLFTGNKGMPLRPVAQVASGGEIARLMLTLKAIISCAVKLPTIVFDEIDTGVSGKIAEQMAAIMKEMGSAGRQVLCITHLPQIAAYGSNHYKVEKYETSGVTTSSMRCLSNSDRITEIAQMISGADITDAAISQAMELLKNNNRDTLI